MKNRFVHILVLPLIMSTLFSCSKPAIPIASIDYQIKHDLLTLDLVISSLNEGELELYGDLSETISIRSNSHEKTDSKRLILPRRKSAIKSYQFNGEDSHTINVEARLEFINETNFKVDFGELGYFLLSQDDALNLWITLYPANEASYSSNEGVSSNQIKISFEKFSES